MDIKAALQEIVNDRRYGAAMLEIIVTRMLFGNAEGVENGIVSEPSALPFDLFFPNGFDAYPGRVAVEIKTRFTPGVARKFLDIVAFYAHRSRNDFDTLLLIVADEITPFWKQWYKEHADQYQFTLALWGLDELAAFLAKDEKTFWHLYENKGQVLLRGTVASGIERQDAEYLQRRQKYIRNLQKEYKKDNIVLFLGAGVSAGAKVATWDTLINELFVELVDRMMAKQNIKISSSDKKRIVDELIAQNGNSPLLQTRFLQMGLADEFEGSVSKLLYKNAYRTSTLLKEIGQLCIPERGKLGIRAVVTYNFDDLIEKNLKRLRVRHRAIYCEDAAPREQELGIYHVHGFLPEDRSEYADLSKSLLVFSEEGYHKLMLEPYNWSNLTQLNFMIGSTCVFLGLSMTDPNMRRLLDIAAQKREDPDTCKHYAVLRRLKIETDTPKTNIRNFEKVNETLVESVYRAIGVNVIWIEDYDELPELLRQIKEPHEEER